MDRDRLALSIRVLTAIALDQREPAPQDVEKIRTMAKSEWEREMPVDELACRLIEREKVHLPIRAARV